MFELARSDDDDDGQIEIAIGSQLHRCRGVPRSIELTPLRLTVELAEGDVAALGGYRTVVVTFPDDAHFTDPKETLAALFVAHPGLL